MLRPIFGLPTAPVTTTASRGTVLPSQATHRFYTAPSGPFKDLPGYQANGEKMWDIREGKNMMKPGPYGRPERRLQNFSRL